MLYRAPDSMKTSRACHSRLPTALVRHEIDDQIFHALMTEYISAFLCNHGTRYVPMSAVAAVWVTTDWTQNEVSHALRELSKNVA